jgi:hypothetical protein
VYVAFAVPLTAEASTLDQDVVGQYVVVWWMMSITVVVELWWDMVVPVLDVVLEVDTGEEVEVETEVDARVLDEEAVDVRVIELDELEKLLA